MSKFIPLFLILFLAVTSISIAQPYGVTNLKIGYFNPKDANSGLILGASIGSAVDESVDVGLGVDFFVGGNKNEIETGSENIGGITEKESYLDSQSSITLLPITGLITVKIPASYSMFYTVGGGAGYGLLWTKEKEFDVNGDKTSSKSRFYQGFRWMVTGGILYKLGTRSSIIFEAFYDSSKLSREQGNLSYKVNPSGFGIRTGVRIGIL